MDNQDNSVELLGEYLKQRRMDKNFTIEKLSQKTKISVNILKNLEANDFKNLPNPAYLKGFVRSYVKTLGISENEALEKMDQTYSKLMGKNISGATPKVVPMAVAEKTPVVKKQNHTSNQSPHEVITENENIIESTKNFLPVIILAVIFLVSFGAYKIISSAIDNEVTKNKVKNHGPVIESSGALLQQPEAPAPAAVAVEATEEVPVVVEEKPAPKPKPELVRNFPPVDFYKLRSKLFTVNEAATDELGSTLMPKETRDSMNSSVQNVYIKAIDGNTWLSYKLDTNPIMSAIINQGRDLYLQGNEIRIFLGNVNVTKIFYNNKIIDTPSKSGVKSLIFPEESNGKYMLPLFPKAKDDILYTAEEYMKRMKIEEDEIKARQSEAQ